MCYSAMAVANFFIAKSQQTDTPITNMHVQKLVFFAHAAYFKKNGRPLISDQVVAWQHGPVIETLYRVLKRYGNNPITGLITRPKKCPPGSPMPYKPVTPNVPPNDTDIVAFLNKAWEVLAKIETWRLRAVSHQKGSAWYTTLINYGIKHPENDDEVAEQLPRNLVILDPVIKKCGF